MATELEVRLTADVRQLRRQLDVANKKLAEFGQASGQAQRGGDKVTKSNRKTSASAVELGRALGDLPFGIQGVANNLQQLAFTLGASGGVTLAVAAVTSALVVLERQGITIGSVFGGLTNLNNRFASSLRFIAKESTQYVASARSEIAELQVLIGLARDEQNSREARIKAIERLQDKYPAFLSNLSLENINTQKLTNQVNKLSDALLNEAKIRGVRSVIEERFGKLAETLARRQSSFTSSANAQIREQNKELQNRQKALQVAIASTTEAAKTDANAAKALAILTAEYKENARLLSAESQPARREGLIAGFIKEDTAQAEAEIRNLQRILAPLLNFDLLNNPGGDAPRQVVQRLKDVFEGASPELINVVQGIVAQISNSLGTLPLKAAPAFDSLEGRLILFRDRLEKSFIDVGGAVSNGFASIGAALAQGQNLFGAVGQAILQTLGGIITQIGEASIKAGIAALSLKGLFKNPAAAIAAGGVLVALGSALSSAQSAVGSIGTSGVGGQGSGSFSGSAGSFSSTGGGFSDGKVVFEIEGQKLVGVLQRTLGRNARLGGNVSLS